LFIPLHEVNSGMLVAPSVVVITAKCEIDIRFVVKNVMGSRDTAA
jgi:hypothetical protein